MPAAERMLRAYLTDLRVRLRALPESEVSDILEELRCHVLDSARARGEAGEGAIAAALARLGSPEELASLYVTDSLLLRAGRSRSPWLLLRSLSRWARVSLAGGFALLGLVVGYVLAASFYIAALAKPFAPGRVGLWRLPGGEISLRLGLVGSAPPGGEELLGWWIVPIGLLLGAAAVWLAARFASSVIFRFRPAPIGR